MWVFVLKARLLKLIRYYTNPHLLAGTNANVQVSTGTPAPPAEIDPEDRRRCKAYQRVSPGWTNVSDDRN